MKFVGAPRVVHRVVRYVARHARRPRQLCTFVNPKSSTYRSGNIVQTARATSQYRAALDESRLIVKLPDTDKHLNVTVHRTLAITADLVICDFSSLRHVDRENVL